jgi:hypothetical protein
MTATALVDARIIDANDAHKYIVNLRESKQRLLPHRYVDCAVNSGGNATKVVGSEMGSLAADVNAGGRTDADVMILRSQTVQSLLRIFCSD